jgi:hypothetical protein
MGNSPNFGQTMQIPPKVKYNHGSKGSGFDVISPANKGLHQKTLTTMGHHNTHS